MIRIFVITFFGKIRHSEVVKNTYRMYYILHPMPREVHYMCYILNFLFFKHSTYHVTRSTLRILCASRKPVMVSAVYLYYILRRKWYDLYPTSCVPGDTIYKSVSSVLGNTSYNVPQTLQFTQFRFYTSHVPRVLYFTSYLLDITSLVPREVLWSIDPRLCSHSFQFSYFHILRSMPYMRFCVLTSQLLSTFYLLTSTLVLHFQLL